MVQITKKILLIIVIITPTFIFAMTTPTVSVTPDATYHYGSYTVEATLEGFFSRVEANTDFLVLEFDTNTIIPASIDPSLVTVRGTESHSVTVDGQRIIILSPVEISRPNFFFPNRDPNFEIVISAAAKIRNPAQSGSDSLLVQAVQSDTTTLIEEAMSNAYTISQSTSTVDSAAVSPTPTVAGQAAAYSIAFNVGSGGFLTAGLSTITLGFDSDTYIPNGSLSGVTVNSTSAIAVSNNDTVLITTPVNIDNDESVSISFALGSGIENPGTGGLYTLAVMTSSEDTFITSQQYQIAEQGDFTITAVSLTPNTANTVSEYDIEFITSSSGALTASVDTITAIVAPNTGIPPGLSPSDVVVSSDGFNDIAAAVSVLKTNTLNQDTIFIVTPITISNSSTVNVTMSTSGAILNPSEAGNYTLKMYTSQDTGMVTSNPYPVTTATTTVSTAHVSPASTTALATTSYEVDFNLGSKGRLQPDVSKIFVKFNDAFAVASDRSRWDSTRISVDQGSFINIDTSYISPDSGMNSVEITLPPAIITANGDNIVLIMDGTGTDPITNPPAGTYALQLRTSVEPVDVSSATFAIGGDSVQNVTVRLSNSTVNDSAQYSFDFTLTNILLRYSDDYLKVIFPEGTEIPPSIETRNVTVNSDTARSVSVSPATRTVTVGIPQFFLTGNVSLVFLENAGIVNPAVPSSSFYHARISTSKDIAPVNSPIYSITGDNTRVTGVSATASPGVRNATKVAYSIDFITSNTGKLVGGAAAGSSTITVDFDDVTLVPTSINPSYVKVNSFVSQGSEVLSSGNGGIVRLTMPDGLTVDNLGSVTILFENLAGLSHRDTAGTFNMQVGTSSDTAFSDTSGTAGDYFITDGQDLTITSVSLNPTTQNTAAGYTVRFTTGSLGALSAGDTIHISFPSNTSLPTVMNLNDIMVNGSNPPANPEINGNTLSVMVPDSIAPLSSVTVLINLAANILNPTLVQSYSLQVSTKAEAGPFTSPSYHISQTTSTISVADVTVNPPSPGSNAIYTLDFSVGENGRLLAGTSTITVSFNDSTTVEGTPASYDSSYIIVDGSSTQIPTTDLDLNNQEITVTVPSGVSVDNGDDIQIILNSIGTPKPLGNPDSPGSYTLQTRSSVETTNITSNEYTISDASPVTNVTMSLAPDVVNAASNDTISFRVQSALHAGTGTVSIKFPFNTFIPASIANSSVRVANNPTRPATFFNAHSVAVNTSTRTITVTVPSDISSGDSVRVAFITSAGLENPSMNGSCTVDLKTSAQPLEAISREYHLQPTTTRIEQLSVDIVPYIPGQLAQFTYNFVTGSRGRLVSGTSTIHLIFPYDVTFTEGVPVTSKVTVNSTAANSLELREGLGQDADTLVVTVPSSVTIGNGTAVTVRIDSTAGVRNASTTSSLSYQAFTSVETAVEGDDISLPVELATFSVENIDGRIVLQWITESETDNSHWFIERKLLTQDEYEQIVSGELNILNSVEAFIPITRIEGQGSQSSRTEYEYTDTSADLYSVYAYRLADVSYSGIKTYHEPAFIIPDAIPEQFDLLQNYPNPFNPETHINYNIPLESRISIRIYNILGQEIIELESGKKMPGFYEIVWEGKNKNHQTVASGIYIYQIVAQSIDGTQRYVQSKKMILVR
jgi:hypothetical protein